MSTYKKGGGRLDWQKALIAEAEETTRGRGFMEMRVVSAFKLHNVIGGYTLPMAVQQYDLVLNSLDGYRPLDEHGVPIDGEEGRVLRIGLRKLRDRKLSTEEEFRAAYPAVRAPASWSKQLV